MKENESLEAVSKNDAKSVYKMILYPDQVL